METGQTGMTLSKAEAQSLNRQKGGSLSWESQKKGMEGVQVKGLQTMLKEYGYYTATVDGKFLDKTELAVKAFQRAEGLDVDGIVGKATWSRLAGLE